MVQSSSKWKRLRSVFLLSSCLVCFASVFGIQEAKAQACFVLPTTCSSAGDPICATVCGDCWTCDTTINECVPNDTLCQDRTVSDASGIARACLTGVCAFDDASINPSGCEYSQTFLTNPSASPDILPDEAACYTCESVVPPTEAMFACGNGVCEPLAGEDCSTCDIDCRSPDFAACVDTTGLDCASQPPSFCEDGDVCTADSCVDTIPFPGDPGPGGARCVISELTSCSGDAADLCCPSGCEGPVSLGDTCGGTLNCDIDCWPNGNPSCNNQIIEVSAGETCDDGVNGFGDAPDFLAGGVLGFTANETQCREPDSDNPCTFCGDSIVDDPTEGCDPEDPATAEGCRAAGTPAECTRCGDGRVDPDADETCDGETGCRAPGTTAECTRCGDGIVDPGEQCDDSPNPCFAIHGSEGTCTSSCECIPAIPFCGDGNLDDGEACDDGNVEVGDGCNESCQIEICGNGRLDAGEACDDGNLISGDGCSSLCEIEIPGTPFCGDGINNQAVEECDGTDNATCGGLSCQATCVCNTGAICGNGIVEGDEQCDGDAAGSCGSLGCSDECTCGILSGSGEITSCSLQKNSTEQTQSLLSYLGFLGLAFLALKLRFQAKA